MKKMPKKVLSGKLKIGKKIRNLPITLDVTRKRRE
jgi:hypothetical protein